MFLLFRDSTPLRSPALAGPRRKIGVAAAEQLYVGQGRGEEKKQYVLDFLKQKGFKVDEESVVNAIEAIVKQLNTEGLTIE